jgi:hypothetical protein
MAFAILAPAAKAEDPLLVSWTEVLPGLSAGYDPDDPNICKSGKDQCVHSVIQEMERRFRPLADSCHHNAVFSLTYLRTTQQYHTFWHEGPFADPGWLNHYDAVFGDYYFRAYDDWYQKDRKDLVPAAWRVAFDAADRKLVSGSGSIFLGMSAHINRDLPFVLYDIGLVAPDGTSRKADHDRVNEFLNRVSDDLFPELARRFDPTVDDGNVPGTTGDDLASFQVVPSWREQAWRNAERLAAAPDEAARELVRQDIERWAELEAESLKTATAYSLLSNFKAADRDAYCAQHNWDV